MTAKRPTLALVREGNPGNRPLDRLEGGVRYPVEAPEEPDWKEWFSAVRVPTAKQLQARFPLGEVEGSLSHIADPNNRAGLAKARQAYLIRRERETAKRAQDDNRRARQVARDEWRRIVPRLTHQGLVALVDRTILVDHCLVVAQIDQANRDLALRGIWVQGERGAVKNPSLTAVNGLRSQLRWSIGELGLSPVARDSLTAGAPDDDEDDGFD